MFLLIELVADVDYSFLDEKYLVYVIELLEKDLVGLQLSRLQIAKHIHHERPVFHVVPAELVCPTSPFQMERGFENGEEFFEVEFFVDFVLDSVREIQINLQITRVVN